MHILLATALDAPRPASGVARWLSERFDASLDLVHVTTPDHPLPASSVDRTSSDARRGIRRLLEREAESLSADDARLAVGDAATTLLDDTAAHEPDLLVVGTEQRSAPSRLLRGPSVAEFVAQGAARPVLIVPHEHAGTFADGLAVLAAVDLGAHFRRVLDTAAAWAHALRGSVTAYHAYGLVPTQVGVWHDAQLTHHKAELTDEVLGRACRELATEDRPIRYRHDAITEPSRGILHCAEDVGAGLIVMGTRAPSTWTRRWGSTTSHVVRHAPCPVLAVPVP